MKNKKLKKNSNCKIVAYRFGKSNQKEMLNWKTKQRRSVREQQWSFAVSKNVLNAVTLKAMDAVEKNEDMQGPFDDIYDLTSSGKKSPASKAVG